MTTEQRDRLRQIARSSSLPHRQVKIANALLLAGEGVATNEVARRVGARPDTVRDWRTRFEAEGVEGVGRVAPGRGRKAVYGSDVVERIVEVTCTTRPPGGETHWSTRGVADEVGVSRETVRRVWQEHGLRPWRVEVFKLSGDPRFAEKLVDVVGLYLDPPERAVVFAFDEKTQVQALDRTQPSLPIKRGRAQTMTHDYKRNGTLDVFAALDVATGLVTSQLRDGHSARDVLAFFKRLDREVPRDLEIHVVLDNLSAHKAPEVTDWLARPRQARWHLHFTPTSSSWLNLVERWFRELTDKRLRRGSFMSVEHLADAITIWIDHWNQDPKPFAWTARAADILAKLDRARDALADATVNSVADH
jgi:Integrase core domain.